MINFQARRWSFRDFVSERGENIILSWLHGLPAQAQEDINTMVGLLEVTERLVRPDVGWLRRECDGLLELRVKSGPVQYRPIGCQLLGERIVILLAGATERDRRLEPLNVCETAFRRMDLVLTNLERYSCEHDLS